MNLPRIAVGLPDSMVFDTRHIRDKTERLGQIARALAIFQITDVIIYRSPFLSMEAAQREKRIIKNILGYLECPQYLRKALFPIQRDLEFVGLLPPLATPHHMVDNRLREGQYREALIFLNDINTVLANVGSKHPIPVNNPPHESLKDKKKRMVVKILKGSDKNPWEAEIVSREKVQNEFYWGFKIKFTDALLVKFQERLKEFFIIATDRGGEPYYQFPEKLKSLKNEQKG
ncbi:MAG: putative RNA uridine N3 methyltransferase, partial [Candidatus Thorarchaeota archaeon]